MVSTKNSRKKMTAKNSTKARNDINCCRRFKRKFRKWVGWNTWPVRYQLRVHLFTLFGTFFLAYFVCLFLYAKFYYQDSVVENLSTEWPGILQDRLVYSSQAISTVFYMADKAFIETLMRVSILY